MKYTTDKPSPMKRMEFGSETRARSNTAAANFKARYHSVLSAERATYMIIIGLISCWTPNEGSSVSSLICNRWLTPISDVYGYIRSPGMLDSANMMFGCGCRAGPTSEPLRRG